MTLQNRDPGVMFPPSRLPHAPIRATQSQRILEYHILPAKTTKRKRRGNQYAQKLDGHVLFYFYFATRVLRHGIVNGVDARIF